MLTTRKIMARIAMEIFPRRAGRSVAVQSEAAPAVVSCCFTLEPEGVI